MKHYVQAILDSDTFKAVKKDVLDNDTTLGEYVKDAVVAKLERSKLEKLLEVTTNNKPKNEKEI